MKCSECNYYYADWFKGHDYDEGNRPYCHFPSVDSRYSTPWDVAPCEEEEHEEPSDEPELWED